MELASGALTVETERRGPAAFHAVLPEMAANFLGEPPDISRAQVASWFSLPNGDLDARLPLEVVSTGLRYLIVPVRDGALARARISHRELDLALAQAIGRPIMPRPITPTGRLSSADMFDIRSTLN